MAPLFAFVVVDIIAKHTGKFQTTSRLMRQNKVATACLIAWGIYHVFVEDYEYH